MVKATTVDNISWPTCLDDWDMTRLIDTHCHLDLDQFEVDRDQVISRARSSDVEKIIVPAIDLDNCHKVLELAERYDCVYAAIGIHPNSTTGWDDEWLDQVRLMASHEKVVAIGEIGLDYYREWSPRSLQQQAFKAQLELAVKLDLPVIIHNREADAHVLDHLKAHGSLRGVLHSFSGSANLASVALGMGFYLGFTGPITFKKADDLRDVAREVPLNQVLIETDAPYLAPQEFRGKRNEPSYVKYVVAKLAELHGISVTEMANVTTDNAHRLFNLSPSEGTLNP